jgi:hypothetical protein
MTPLCAACKFLQGEEGRLEGEERYYKIARSDSAGDQIGSSHLYLSTFPSSFSMSLSQSSHLTSILDYHSSLYLATILFSLFVYLSTTFLNVSFSIISSHFSYIFHLLIFLRSSFLYLSTFLSPFSMSLLSIISSHFSCIFHLFTFLLSSLFFLLVYLSNIFLNVSSLN